MKRRVSELGVRSACQHNGPRGRGFPDRWQAIAFSNPITLLLHSSPKEAVAVVTGSFQSLIGVSLRSMLLQM